MRRLTIGGKEYTFKFSIEASLYSECTESVMNMFLSYGEAQGEMASAVDVASEDVARAKSGVVEAFRKTFANMANIPQTALTLFYAGLLEEHSDAIRSKNDAKKLLGQYISELDEKDRNFYYVTNLMIEIMGEDHFFDLTGLTKILNAVGNAPEEETGKA